MGQVKYAVYDETATPPRIRCVTGGDVIAQAGPSFVHLQDTPASAWEVQHNLGSKLLDVKTFLTTGEEVVGDPDWTGATVNRLSIKFARDLTGTAVIRSL
jgi:hypothetical protein